MLHFVIPLRSASTTRDWPAVQRLLEQTLRSVDNQICRDFRCLVVCHEKPDLIEFPHSCEILEAPFDAPKINLDRPKSDETLFQMRSDKGRKLILGLFHARVDPAAFVMFLDADDLPSSRLSLLVHDNPTCNGWYFERGYRWNSDTPNLIFPRESFYHECGSSYIIRSELAPFPALLDFSKDFDDYYIRRYVVHAYVKENMEKLGHPLVPLPFPGCIYTFNRQNFFADVVRGNDSALRKLGRIIFKGRLVTDALRAEFCIPT